MIRVIMHGCNGKMGQVITGLIAGEDSMEIVAGIDPYDGIANDYPVFKSCADCTVDADVIIDFSSAAAIDSLLDYIEEKKMPVVLCTTGLSKEQIERVENVSRNAAVLRSANMSLGINLLLKLVQNAAKVLYADGFDIEIVERHHNQKVDAPSGTAMALADSINEALNHELNYVYDRSQVRQKRERNDLGISAVRGGTIVGDHDVIFAGTDEVVEIKHTAYSKAVFAKGAVAAARFLAGKPAGHYQMSDVIQL
ncbi:4-hydroxy-tetrahydrodipicolinate reductase [Anaerolentibacter hominis]|uniref:4-hydroxy-tetrahydrodipicolinate reductase n=1 Tax=Anaerolentibacter hominis TaxID=3079009 RepID=UPI0031B8026F